MWKVEQMERSAESHNSLYSEPTSEVGAALSQNLPKTGHYYTVNVTNPLGRYMVQGKRTEKAYTTSRSYTKQST